MIDLIKILKNYKESKKITLNLKARVYLPKIKKTFWSFQRGMGRISSCFRSRVKSSQNLFGMSFSIFSFCEISTYVT